MKMKTLDKKKIKLKLLQKNNTIFYTHFLKAK